MLLFLLGCPSPDTGKTTDTARDTDPAVDTDTGGSPAVDQDKDGYDSTEDCDDNNYLSYPGAPEICDGEDNDCDSATDEDFDGDEDGAFDAALCEGGTDCDDADPQTYTGATEIPYDGIDQDCDGADLVDVDGDLYSVTFDCDDTDASVHPDAPEVAKDGIDQDCDGLDLLDGDGDGYDDADWAGDDCDDADPGVHPGATDAWADGLDADCDGLDGTAGSVTDASVIISGDRGDGALVGQDVTTCDLDGDLLPDLIVSAPFAASYDGQIGIFYGDGAASWSNTMSMDDADTLIQGRAYFLGFNVACGDFDGDGHDDLLTGRGEIQFKPSYVTTFEVIVWYGDGARLRANLSELDADASLEMTLGVTEGLTSVYNRDFGLVDADGDAAMDLVVSNPADRNLSEADDHFYVVGGGRYEGELTLVDEASASIAGEGISVAASLPDLDGDGVSELFFGESGRGSSWETGDTGLTFVGGAGRASLVNRDDLATADLGDLAYGFWEGEGAGQLGFSAAAGDFDGDGLQDLAISNVSDETNAIGAGGVYVFSPIEGAGGLADATASVLGAYEYGYFGYQLLAVGDENGDGIDDLLVSELYAEDTRGRMWLLDGSALAGDVAPELAALAAWDGETELEQLGMALAGADFDADGLQDFVVGAYTQSDDGTNYNGRVYVLLSGAR